MAQRPIVYMIIVSKSLRTLSVLLINVWFSRPLAPPAPVWHIQKLLVLVLFLFYGPSTHFRSFRARSVNLATLFLGKPPRHFTSTNLVHILSPVTDNCSSWISGRGRVAVEMFSWPSRHVYTKRISKVLLCVGGEGERGSAGTESLSERLVYFMFFLHQVGSPGGSPPDIF